MQIPTSSLSRAATALSALVAEQRHIAGSQQLEGQDPVELLAEIRRNEAARADILSAIAVRRADEREQQRASCYGA
jgi:hypothetical protein